MTESNITKTFGYKSSFYLSFIANKDSLSDTYLEARKALYKTYQQIKQEQTEELQKTTTRARASTMQNLTTNNNIYITKDSYLVLESNDTKIIFLDSLKHTYTNFTSHANTSFVNPKAYANNHDSISLNFSNKDILCRV